VASVRAAALAATHVSEIEITVLAIAGKG